MDDEPDIEIMKGHGRKCEKVLLLEMELDRPRVRGLGQHVDIQVF